MILYVLQYVQTIYALPKTFPNYKEKLVDDENFSNVIIFFLLLTGCIWSPIKNPSHNPHLSNIRTNEY